jgi:hypothetical protein
MIKLTVALIAIFGVSAGAYFLSRRAEQPHTGSAPAAPVKSSGAAESRSSWPAQVRPATAPLSVLPTRADVDELDALDEVAALRDSAHSGKAEAQYRLYELLSGCESEYSYYFSRGDKVLTKDEAAARMEALASMDEYAVGVYRTCHRLMEERPELVANAREWQEKALAQRSPRAQTARAAELLAAAAVANPAAGKAAAPNAEREAKALLSSAMASGDAQVLWTLGELRPALGGAAEDTNKERWAMELAACDRGFACGPDAQWVKRYCKSDPASLCPINANAEEMIRSKTASDFEMIKMRAKEINALIDSGRGSELVPPP